MIMSKTLNISLEEDESIVGDLDADTTIASPDEAKQTSDTSVQTTDTNNVSNEKPTVLVMKGPLSEIYTKALDIVFTNKDSADTLAIVATESMLNDVVMNAAIKEAMTLKKPTVMTLEVSDDYNKGNEIVYCTTSEDFNSNKAMGVINGLSAISGDNPNANVSLVVDGGSKGRYGATIGTSEELGLTEDDNDITLNTAVESICHSVGIKVFHSLKDYINSLERK